MARRRVTKARGPKKVRAHGTKTLEPTRAKRKRIARETSTARKKRVLKSSPGHKKVR